MDGEAQTHRIAVGHSLDLVVVLALCQPAQTLWEQLATRRVELLPIVHRQFSTERVDGDDKRSPVSLKLCVYVHMYSG